MFWGGAVSVAGSELVEHCLGGLDDGVYVGLGPSRPPPLAALTAACRRLVKGTRVAWELAEVLPCPAHGSLSPMAAPAVQRATYADLLELPDDMRAEIVAGQIITAPAALPRHSKVQGAIRSFVGRPFDDDDGHGGPGGWWIFVEVDVQLGLHDVVRPDLAGWRRPRLLDPGDKRPIDVVPDWICEVLSPRACPYIPPYACPCPCPYAIWGNCERLGADSTA